MTSLILNSKNGEHSKGPGMGSLKDKGKKNDKNSKRRKTGTATKWPYRIVRFFHQLKKQSSDNRGHKRWDMPLLGIMEPFGGINEGLWESLDPFRNYGSHDRTDIVTVSSGEITA